MRILVVDDEVVAVDAIRRILKYRGYRQINTCQEGREAVERIRETDFDVVLLDILMPDMDGLQVLEKTKPLRPLTEFIMVTALDQTETAVQAMHRGAYDYLVKPIDPERIVLSIEKAFERRALVAGQAGGQAGSKKTDLPQAFKHMVTESPRMREIIDYAHTMARGGRPILITGETGTGKELFARGIHGAGPYADGPFVSVNVTSVPESLFESLFFGHGKGAFTGAEKSHAGYFEQANHGVLYLDEIGELPLTLQTKLLRVLEEKTVVRLGEGEYRNLDLGVISSTNRDLDEACREGLFRLDLLYRIKSAHVHLPPLRERPLDISALATHFLKQVSLSQGKNVKRISPEAMAQLLREPFPGNVRELANAVENAVLLTDTDVLYPAHFGSGRSVPPLMATERVLCSLKENEAAHVAFVLQQTAGDRKEVARILNVTVRQVQRKLVQLKDHPRWGRIIEQY
jgi:DNA-binding NtrC family response regulator